MADFDDFLAALKDNAEVLAKEIFDGYKDQAKQDAEAFIDKAKDDLERWTRLLAKGDINEEDFSDLVNAKKALAEMFALRQAGLSLIKLEKFRKGFINLVVDTAFEVFV
ncbi:hypothetical protein Q4488_01935 [Amphritea sp. 1_MG-2023]|uniref:hypothetical protein n=1 Tax=Amphritea sp. 1_MG-2023 TaxID=3062670 RepID=UPI0026E389C6|nr:hypothetical protein [Amphritea sp. 1_MG-2023]MDO6562130.1 hypothetical protein [Amphritea sp. 1_MG-2023]